MKLEDEIVQKKFKSEHEKLFVNILFTGNWLNTLQKKKFKKHDITPDQYNVLRILKGQYPKSVSIQLIASRMLNKSSNASRIVDKLKSMDLLERKEAKHDRRLVDVVINQKGLACVEQISKNVWDGFDFFNKFTEEQAKELNEYLDKLRDM